MAPPDHPYFSYALAPHKNPFNGTVLMMGHRICFFCGEIWLIIPKLSLLKKNNKLWIFLYIRSYLWALSQYFHWWFFFLFFPFFSWHWWGHMSVIKSPYSTTISLKVPEKPYFNVFSLLWFHWNWWNHNTHNVIAVIQWITSCHKIVCPQGNNTLACMCKVIGNIQVYKAFSHWTYVHFECDTILFE